MFIIFRRLSNFVQFQKIDISEIDKITNSLKSGEINDSTFALLNSDGFNPYVRFNVDQLPTELDNKEIGSMIKDFYLTDSISRLSKTMAECSQIRKELRNGKAI